MCADARLAYWLAARTVASDWGMQPVDGGRPAVHMLPVSDDGSPPQRVPAAPARNEIHPPRCTCSRHETGAVRSHPAFIVQRTCSNLFRIKLGLEPRSIPWLYITCATFMWARACGRSSGCWKRRNQAWFNYMREQQMLCLPSNGTLPVTSTSSRSNPRHVLSSLN